MQKLPVGLVTTGFTFLVLGVLMGWVIVPKIIDDQIYKQVQLKNGTETWEKWSDIPIPVYLKFYIFNVTNPLEVERGGKPRLQEVGPYTYREKRRKVDLSVSADEDTVTYRQPVDYFFDEEMSSGTEDDLINIINIPFVAVVKKTEAVPAMLQFLVNAYLNGFGQTLFMERTVGELLFQGYHEPLLTEIQDLTGQEILKDEKFGLYYPAVASMINPVSPQLANLIMNVLRVVSLGSESMVRKKIRLGDLTFKGFPVPYYAIPLEILSNLAPTFNITAPELPPEFGGGRFGFYNGKNQSDDGIFEVYTGMNDRSKFGHIKSWNNLTKLDWWLKTPGDYCNMINGTDGSLYPPFVKKDRVLYIYHPDICRSLGLTYSRETEFMGIPGYRFTAPRSMLEDPKVNHDNLCFCPDDSDNYASCLKAGAIDLSGCRDGAPVAMSTPHFFEADEEYVEQSIGIRPVEELHQTYLDIEPNTGLIMQAHKRIQINVRLQKMPYIDALKNVPDMLFPVLWADEYATLDDENANFLKKQLITPLKIVEVTKWVIICVSLILIFSGFIVCFIRVRRRKYPV